MVFFSTRILLYYLHNVLHKTLILTDNTATNCAIEQERGKSEDGEFKVTR